jgi:hypothetical protein
MSSVADGPTEVDDHTLWPSNRSRTGLAVRPAASTATTSTAPIEAVET